MNTTLISDLVRADEEDMHNEIQLINLFHLLRQTLVCDLPGSIVELGCFTGTSTVLLQNVIDYYRRDKTLHVYDSFEGLPPKTDRDAPTIFTEGDCQASQRDLIKKFNRFDTNPPEIHVGWLEDTLPEELPDTICFAHIDVDFYTSTLHGLENVYPRVVPKGIIVIDDFCNPKVSDCREILPGVRRACNEYLHSKENKVKLLLSGEGHSHAFIEKSQ